VPALAEPVKLAALLRDWPTDRALFFADETGGAPASVSARRMRGPRPMATALGTARIAARSSSSKPPSGWEPVLEGDNVIALNGVDGSISLEPAGQFELSGAPLENLRGMCRSMMA